MGIVVLGILLLAGCSSTRPNGAPGSAEALPTGLVGPVAPTAGPGALRYVALGDSYPFGDGVQQADRWPNQLVRILRPDLDLELDANLSGRSVATQQVINDQLPKLAELRPQFVTIQVGANDIINVGPDAATFRQNMGTILDGVLDADVPADRIVVVTIPDFTLYPLGDIFGGSEAKQQRIVQYNEITQELAQDRGIVVVDITPIADRVPEDPTLVAADDRHPSGKQYAGWADLVAETVRRLFRDQPPRHRIAFSHASPGAPAASPGAAGASVSP